MTKATDLAGLAERIEATAVATWPGECVVRPDEHAKLVTLMTDNIRTIIATLRAVSGARGALKGARHWITVCGAQHSGWQIEKITDALAALDNLENVT